MIVLVLSAVPSGLRGHVTRWLLEIAPGVFVGHLPARVRDQLWQRVSDLQGNGRALMVYSASGEQRLSFRIFGHDWLPEDHDGIQLVRRPPTGEKRPAESGRTRNAPENWSIAARRRRFGSSVPRRKGPE